MDPVESTFYTKTLSPSLVLQSDLSKSVPSEERTSLHTLVPNNSSSAPSSRKSSPRIRIETSPQFLRNSSPRNSSGSNSPDTNRPTKISPRVPFKNWLSSSSLHSSEDQAAKQNELARQEKPFLNFSSSHENFKVSSSNSDSELSLTHLTIKKESEESLLFRKSLSSPDRLLINKHPGSKDDEIPHNSSSKSTSEAVHSRSVWGQISPRRELKKEREVRKLSGKKQLTFEKSLLDYLEEQQSKKLGMPQVSAIKIKKTIYGLCRQEVEGFFEVSHTSDFAKLYTEVVQHLEGILAKIQNNSLILKDISARFLVLYHAANRWQEACHTSTNWSEELTQKLKVLANMNEMEIEVKPSIGVEGHESDTKLRLFLEVLNSFLASSQDKRVEELVFKGIGDSIEERELVLDELNKWSSSQPRAMQKLDNYIKKACAENILANTMPFKEHLFRISHEGLEVLTSRISPYEIFRCIRPDKHVLFDSIKINKKILHQTTDLLDGLEEKEDRKKKKQSFWKKLFHAIYKRFQPTISDEEINEQISVFKTCRNAAVIESAETKIPCLKVLKLMTNSCWGVGYKYFDECFPDVKQSPHWLKLKPGIDCAINIVGNDTYQVTQIKNATIYPLLNPTDPTSFVIDDMRPLARMRISWTVKVTPNQLEGKLKIIKSSFAFLKPATEEERWLIRQRLVNVQSWQHSERIENI